MKFVPISRSAHLDDTRARMVFQTPTRWTEKSGSLDSSFSSMEYRHRLIILRLLRNSGSEVIALRAAVGSSPLSELRGP